MEQGSKPAAKPRRKLRAWMVFPLFLLAAWVFCEVYDHVPKRSWFYRQTHTLFFIDVTAKLEIDGEPLTMTRTIRCIRQPPVRGLAINWAAPDSRNVFDAVGGVSNTGRTFILNAPKACEAILFHPANEAFAARLGQTSHRPQPDDDPDHMKPVSYSAGNLVAPVIYEPVGGYIPDKILAYLAAPELFTTGNHGVKFVDLTISQSSRSFMLFDTTRYDMIRMTEWYTPTAGSQKYSVVPITEFPKEYWTSSEFIRKAITDCQSACVITINFWRYKQELDELRAKNVGFIAPGYHALQDIAASSSASNSASDVIRYKGETYSTAYVNGHFEWVRDSKNILIFAQLPSDSTHFEDGRRGEVRSYSFAGDIRSMAEGDVLYISQDHRVLRPYSNRPILNVWR